MHWKAFIVLLALTLFLPLASKAQSKDYPVYFRWAKSSYDPDYMGNAASVNELVKTISEVGTDSIRSIDINSYASPDGVYEYNLQLSRLRAREVRWLLRTRAPEAYSKVKMHLRGEAWGLLRERVEKDTRMTEASRNRVLKFLDNKEISDDTRKWRLEHWLGSDPKVGDLYKYLFRAHYRYLRSAVIIVVNLEPVSQDNAPAVEARPLSGQPALNPAAGETGVVSDVSVAAKALTDSELANSSTPDSTHLKPATASESATYLPRSEEPKPAEPEKAAIAEEPKSAETKNAAAENPTVVEAPKATEPQKTAAAEGKPKQEWLPLFGISTNLIYDLCYVPGYGLTSIPSFSLEYYPRKGRFTFGADVEWPMWQHEDTHKYMQINNISLWARRWFKPVEERFNGLYLYAGANAARYGVGWNEKGWKGEGLGASLGIGHKWLLGKSRFYIDAGLGLGVFWSAYDPYYFSDEATHWYYYDYSGMPEEFHKRSKRLLWFGPTRAYISIGFDIHGRKRR